MLQQEAPEDFVIATGETHSVREFISEAAKELDISIRWEGKGVEEKGIDEVTERVLVVVDPRYFRPTEVGILQGDAGKAREKLGWKPRIRFRELVSEMVRADLRAAEMDRLCTNAGFQVYNQFE